MSDRLLCASRAYLEMYVLALVSERGATFDDFDIDEAIQKMRTVGRADLIVEQYGQLMIA